MPLFEFRCTECGMEFEKLVRRAGTYDGVACPVCHGEKVQEMLSTFASLGKNPRNGSQSGRCKPAGG